VGRHPPLNQSFACGTAIARPTAEV
jgi:hypothetical protein